MKYIGILGFVSILMQGSLLFASVEQNCREEIRSHVLAAASTLTPGIVVSDFKNLKPTGKKVKTANGEILYEYTVTDLSSDDDWIPDSSAAIYVKKDSLTCSVIRLNVNLR